MKLRLLASLLALAVVASPCLRAQDAGAAAKPASSETKTDLEKQMDQVGKAFRTLRKQVSDPTKNDSSIQLVETMIEHVKASAELTPAKAADIPEDQKAKFMDGYKKGIQGMVDKLTALEALLKAGKNDEASKAVADIQQAEKQGHKEYRKEKPQS